MSEKKQYTLAEYQADAVKTKLYPEEKKIEYCSLGLCGESGEIAEKVKKWIRGDKELVTKDIVLELGDVLWYVACFAEDIGSSLEEVAKLNIEKLESREARNKIKGDGDHR